MKTICAFCGSADHLKQPYLEVALELGRTIAVRNLQLWYGAGSTGVMGALANGALEAGGQVIG